MVHRRLLRDDGFGVVDPLNEEIDGKGLMVNGKQRIFIGNKESSAKWRRLAMQENYLHPMYLFISSHDIPKGDWNSKVKREFQGLWNPLPENVNILSMETEKPDRILLRIEHLFEANENENLSKEVEIELGDLFTNFEVKGIEEMTLGGNVHLSQAERLHWQTNDWQDHEDTHSLDRFLTTSKIKLNPMEIRTFILTVQRNPPK